MTTRRDIILGPESKITQMNIILFSTVRSGHNFIRQQIESWGDYAICNAEDLQPINFEISKSHLVANKKLVDWDKDTVKIVVIRDLLNWWASYTNWIHKSWVPGKHQIDKAFYVWSAMVKETFLATEYLDCSIPINYDVFKSSRPFRKLICSCLNGLYDEATLDKVTPQGNGSSFDSGDVAHIMDTHLRYRHIMQTQYAEFYVRTLREHPEAIELYKAAFSNHITDDQELFLNLL